MSKKLKLKIGNHTDVGQVRSINQDSFGVSSTDWGDLFIVADGMGGHKGGEVASKLTVQHIIKSFEKDKVLNPLSFLNKSIIEANSIVSKKSSEDISLDGMGTTVVAMIVKGSKAFIAHVGDSRLYIYRNKKYFQITKDHSVVQKMVDEGIIKDSEMETHPRKNQILQAVGLNNIEPSLTAEVIYKNDIILLCSDGLTGEVDTKTIFNLLNSNDMQLSTQKLINEANKNGGNDNITAILVKVLSGGEKNFDPGASQIIQPKKKKLKFSKFLILPIFIIFLLSLFVYNFIIPTDEIEKDKYDQKEYDDENDDNPLNFENNQDSSNVKDTTTVNLSSNNDSLSNIPNENNNHFNSNDTIPTDTINSSNKKRIQ